MEKMEKRNDKIFSLAIISMVGAAIILLVSFFVPINGNIFIGMTKVILSTIGVFMVGFGMSGVLAEIHNK